MKGELAVTALFATLVALRLRLSGQEGGRGERLGSGISAPGTSGQYSTPLPGIFTLMKGSPSGGGDRSRGKRCIWECRDTVSVAIFMGLDFTCLGVKFLNDFSCVRRGASRACEAGHVQVHDGIMFLLIRVIDIADAAEALAQRLGREAVALQLREQFLEVFANRGLLFLKAKPALIAGAQHVVGDGKRLPAVVPCLRRLGSGAAHADCPGWVDENRPDVWTPAMPALKVSRPSDWLANPSREKFTSRQS